MQDVIGKDLIMPKILTPNFDELSQINWLRNCGKITEVNYDFNSRHIKDPKVAAKTIESIGWENFQLDRSGDTTVFLNAKFNKEYQSWNKISKIIKANIEQQLVPILNEKGSELALSKIVIDSIKWDILSYFQEECYSQFRIPRFYNSLYKIYRSGHIPCGWEGNYPDGSICIF